MSGVARFLVAFLLSLIPALSWAQTAKSDYSVLIDADHDPATGCSVALPTAGRADGIERRLTATVASAPQVASLTLESCVNGRFGTPAAVPGTPFPVGFNTGVAGADVIELAAPSGAVAAPDGTVRLYFAARGPSSDDLLATVDGSANGAPILFASSPVPIPTLTGWSLLLLVFLLAAIAASQHRRGAAHALSVLPLLFVLGVAVAAGFVLDGQVNDWQGVPAAGSDARGDSAPETDIIAVFAAQEGDNLFFRIDIANAEASPSSNRPPVFTSTPITTASVGNPYAYNITATDPDGNALTLTAPTLPAWLTFTPGANGAGTLSGIPGPADLGPHAVVLRVTDNGTPSLSADQAFTTTVGSAANPAPVLDLNGPAAGIDFAATFTEGGGAAAIVDPSNLTVIDPDSLNLASATITLTNLLDTGQETVAVSTATVAPNTPITAAYNAATGVLTLIGSAPLAQYQAALRTVTYSNAAAAPTATPARAITFVVSDGSNTSAVATATVTVTSVNDQPNFTASNPPAVNEDAGLQTVNGWATFDPGAPDESGQTVLAYLVSNVSNAALFTTPPTVDTSGNLSYTPAPNAFGTSTFEVRVQDNGGTANGGVDTSAPQTFTITVNGINDQPSFTASNPPAVNENAGAQTVAGWATFNPGNAQESAQAVLAYTVSNVSNPALFSPQPSVAANGNLTYTPAAGANGTSTFEVRVQDSGGTANGGVDTSAAQTFSTTVNAVDDPPIAVNDTATLAEDALATTIDVLANDTDPDGGPKLIGAVQNPSTNGGTVLITGGGTGLTYQPAADYCNTPPGAPLDTFTYTLTPGGSTSTVTVTVNCVNDPPVVDLNGPAAGIDFAATFTEGGGAVAIVDNANLTVSDVDSANLASATVTLTNLLDAGQETLAVAATTVSPNTPIVATYNTGTPGQGVLTLTGSTTLAQYQAALRTLTYNNGSPNPNTTARSVTFVVNDGTDDSAIATSTVTVTAVNSPPVVNSATFTLDENSANGTAVGTVTFTDSDTGQSHTFAITGGNTGGAFAIDTTSGAITVATSTALDFETTSTFSLTVQVTDNGTPAQSGTATVTVNLTNVNDPPVVTPATFSIAENSANGTAVGTVTFTDSDTGQTHAFAITGGNTGGAFAINATTGAITVANSTALDFETTPSFSLTAQVTDNGTPAQSGTATVTVNLTDVNEPPVANPQSVTTLEDIAVAITLTGTDPENQTLTFTPTAPSQGVLSGTAPNLTYTPNPNTNGADSFTFTVSDSANTSAPATVSITITAVDDPPVAVPDSASVNEDAPATAINVLANDPDIDGGPKFVNSVTSPSANGGTVAITGGGTGLTYAPNANYCNAPPGTTPDTFSYTLNGGSTATVSVTVNCFNDPPVATAKAHQTHSGILITIGAADTGKLKDGATDVDDPVTDLTVGATFTSVTPAGATITLTDATTGTFTYNPPAGYSGPASFNYQVCDDGTPVAPVQCGVNTVSFNITGPDLWFVQQGTSGSGRLTDPLGSLASLPAGRGNGDRIFVFAGAYGTGHTLLASEHLIGQGATGAFDTVLGVVIPSVGTLNTRPTLGGARPTLQGTVTLNTNSAVRGLNLSTGSATGLNDPAGAITGVTVSEVSSTTTTGTAVNLTNAGGTLSFTSISANGAANGIVLNTTTGSFTVTGNSAGLCGGGVSSATPPATAIAPVAADCSGGTIQNSTGPGVSLTNTSNVSLTRMRINNGSDDGIRGIGVNGFTLASSLIEANGPVGSPTFYSNLDFGEDQLNGFTGNFVGLTGTASITNSTIRSGSSNNLLVRTRDSSPRTLALTITGSVISGNPANAFMNDGILLEASQNATITSIVTGNVFSAHKGDHFQAAASNNGNQNVTFTNNTLTGGHSTALGQGITINAATDVPGYAGRIDYDINGNNINGAVSNGVSVILGTSSAAAVFDGFIRNNVIGTSGSSLSCSNSANGLGIDARGNGKHNVSVTGNTIRQCFDRGILSEAGDGDSVLNLTVQSNTIDQQVDPGAREAIQTNYGITTTNVFGNVDTNNVCLQLGGAGALANVFSHGGGAPDDFRLRKRHEATVRLPGYAGGTGQDAASLAAVVAFIQGQNTGSAGEPGSATASGAGGGYTGGAACTLPSL